MKYKSRGLPMGSAMKTLKKRYLVVLAFLLAPLAHSGVNLKNGNFYISYTDIIVPGGGKKLEITRTYNSKATEMGWFGFGWGSPFETKLELSADGSVIVHENGAGGRTRFTPKTKVDADSASKKIVEAMRKNTPITEKAAKKLVDRLKKNAELRHAYALNFGVKSSLAPGTVLYSNERGLQEVHKLKKGFVRKYNDGRKEYFDDKGNLIKSIDKNKYTVELKYKKDNSLESIKDSQAKQLFFSWYPDGRVKHIWSAGDKKTWYKYKGKDLVFSKDIAGNVYKYEYDTNHNLIAVDYSENKKSKGREKMTIKYEPKTYFVSKIVDRNGDYTKYKYGSDPKNPDMHYWTEVAKKGFDGKEIANRYEYEIRTRPDGSQYTHKIKTRINNISTETIYTECCGLPKMITRGKHWTKFDYNDDGLLKEKTTSRGEFVKINYDKKLKKISKVENNAGWTKFSYDAKGNLKKAKNSKGKAVLLVYDRKGKITKMVDHNEKSKKRRTLAFEYNAMGKPVVITMEKVGKINVTYDNYGEIKKVDSKSGHKMALQVTQAFQNLLQIVKPAGVNLNM
jgi:YD repeat-containing protein